LSGLPLVNGAIASGKGVHRYHASLVLGFSHVPAEIIDWNF
jgi:hypothetical protein